MSSDRIMKSKDGRDRVIVSEKSPTGGDFYRPVETTSPTPEKQDPLIRFYEKIEDLLADKIDGFVQWFLEKRGK